MSGPAPTPPPAEEEITRIRRLISRIKGDITKLTDAERAQVDEAVTVIRKHRAVSLGMPSVRAPRPARKRGPRMTSSAATTPARQGRRARGPRR